MIKEKRRSLAQPRQVLPKRAGQPAALSRLESNPERLGFEAGQRKAEEACLAARALEELWIKGFFPFNKDLKGHAAAGFRSWTKKSEADLYGRFGRLAQALLEASIDGETR